MAWYVYMLRCGDGSLYTGSTTDVARRLRELTAWTGMHRNSIRDFTVERCTSIRAERRMKRF